MKGEKMNQSNNSSKLSLSSENTETNNPQQTENSKMIIPDTPEVTTKAPNPFDPESLRLNPENFDISVEKVIVIIPCRKPGKQEYVRVHPSEKYQDNFLILEDEDTGENYIVAPSLHEQLIQECFPARLVLAVSRNGTPFLWLLKLPRDGRSNSWYDSALIAAQTAETRWVRMKSNMSAKCYDVEAAKGLDLEPQWPNLEFKEILKLCFKDRFIDSLDHPLLRKLRGEV